MSTEPKDPFGRKVRVMTPDGYRYGEIRGTVSLPGGALAEYKVNFLDIERSKSIWTINNEEFPKGQSAYFAAEEVEFLEADIVIPRWMGPVQLTDEQLTEIKRLDSERTQGTWHWRAAQNPAWSELLAGTRVLLDNTLEGFANTYIVMRDTSPDAQFIAAASWTVPALLAEIERQRRTIAELLGIEARYFVERIAEYEDGWVLYTSAGYPFCGVDGEIHVFVDEAAVWASAGVTEAIKAELARNS